METRHAETVLPRTRSALTLEAPLFPTSKIPTSTIIGKRT
jgi:hypothetical protein